MGVEEGGEGRGGKGWWEVREEEGGRGGEGRAGGR